jgi:hypothetical protein
MWSKEEQCAKFWSEHHVSEDFDLFMRLAAHGRIGRYVTYTGNGFQVRIMTESRLSASSPPAVPTASIWLMKQKLLGFFGFIDRKHPLPLPIACTVTYTGDGFLVCGTA